MSTQIDQKNIIPQDILILWDESGSMSVMKNEPVDAINTFIDGQRESIIGDSTVTFAKFNTKLEYIYQNTPLPQLPKLEYKDYMPTGMTSLYDAICKSFQDKLDSKRKNNTIAFILTDGEENASLNHTRQDVSEIIDLVEKSYNWKVIFVGANINLEQTTTEINVSQTRTAEFDQSLPGTLLKLCRQTSNCISQFRKARSENKYNNETIDLNINKNKSSPI